MLIISAWVFDIKLYWYQVQLIISVNDDLLITRVFNQLAIALTLQDLYWFTIGTFDINIIQPMFCCLYLCFLFCFVIVCVVGYTPIGFAFCISLLIFQQTNYNPYNPNPISHHQACNHKQHSAQQLAIFCLASLCMHAHAAHWLLQWYINVDWPSCCFLFVHLATYLHIYLLFFFGASFSSDTNVKEITKQTCTSS